jgi:hypothetical protein
LRQDISRRSALRNLGRAAALAALPLAASRQLSASVYGRKKVAALAIGGDRYHNMDYIRTALAKTLGKDLGLSLDFSDEVTLLATRYLKDYKLLIVFRDGMNWPNGYSSMGGGRNSRMVSEPPVPGMEEKQDYWITAAQGKSVKERRAGRGDPGTPAAAAVQGEDREPRPPHHARRRRFRGDRRAALCPV